MVTSSTSILGGNIFPSRAKLKGSLIFSGVDVADVADVVVDAAAVGLACL